MMTMMIIIFDFDTDHVNDDDIMMFIQDDNENQRQIM